MTPGVPPVSSGRGNGMDVEPMVRFVVACNADGSPLSFASSSGVICAAPAESVRVMNHRNGNLRQRRERGRSWMPHFSSPSDLKPGRSSSLAGRVEHGYLSRLHICFLRGAKRRALRVAGILSSAAVWRMQSSTRFVRPRAPDEWRHRSEHVVVRRREQQG